MRRRRTRRAAQDWARLVRDLERSGKTVKAFAAERQVSPSTLCWWRWRLARAVDTEPRAAGEPASEMGAVRLLPVEIAAEDDDATLGWSVRFASGHELRVQRPIGVAELEILLRALRDGGPDR